MINYLRLRPTVDRLVRIGSSHPATSRLTQALYSHRRELRRFTKFALVGTLGTVVDFSTLNILHLVFGLSLVLSNTLSFSVAVVNNFTWNRLWTFPESRECGLGEQLLKFGLVNVIGLGINQLVFLNLNHYVFEPWVGRFGYNLAKAVAIIVVLFWNFGVNRIWTYKNIC